MANKKTIYVSNEQMPIWDKAKKLFKDEKSFSQLITDALEREIQKKYESAEFEEFDIEDNGEPVKLIGKKLASYGGYHGDDKFIDRIKRDIVYGENGMIDGVDIYTDDSKKGKIIQVWCKCSKDKSPKAFSIFPEKYYEFNAFITRKGNYYIEVIYFIDKNTRCSYLKYINNIWRFLNPAQSEIETIKILGNNLAFERNFSFPSTLIGDLEKAGGFDHLPRIIE